MATLITEQGTPYRDRITVKDLVSFTIIIKETNLLICADTILEKEAQEAVVHYRYQIEDYIRRYPYFLSSLTPLPFDESAPPIVQEMLRAGHLARVGPMASVAGALAEMVGKDLLAHTTQVVVENGGDIFLKVAKDVTAGIYAGNSPLSNKLGLKIPSARTPIGVCTSSGTVGHSLSFGSSDAVTVVATSTSLADAAATSIGNLIKNKRDIDTGLARARDIEGVVGVLIIVDDQFGAWGSIEIVST